MSRADILAEVTCRVLEDCAFLFLEKAEEAEDADVENAIPSSIVINAEQPHVLKLVASRPLLLEAAANMLGTEADDPEVAGGAEQVIGELLNVVAGSLVARLFGTAAEVGLGIPQRVDPHSVGGDAVVLVLRADSGDFLRLELR